MAELIAQTETVARVISFSGGWDYADSRAKKIAGWYSKNATTPMDRWFATYNVNENAAKGRLVLDWSLSRMPAARCGSRAGTTIGPAIWSSALKA